MVRTARKVTRKRAIVIVSTALEWILLMQKFLVDRLNRPIFIRYDGKSIPIVVSGALEVVIRLDFEKNSRPPAD